MPSRVPLAHRVRARSAVAEALEITADNEHGHTLQPKAWSVHQTKVGYWAYVSSQHDSPAMDQRFDMSADYPCFVYGVDSSPDWPKMHNVPSSALVQAGLSVVLGPKGTRQFSAFSDYASKLISEQWSGLASRLNAQLEELVEKKVESRLAERLRAGEQLDESVRRIADHVRRKAKSAERMSLRDALALVDVTALADDD